MLTFNRKKCKYVNGNLNDDEEPLSPQYTLDCPIINIFSYSAVTIKAE